VTDADLLNTGPPSPFLNKFEKYQFFRKNIKIIHVYIYITLILTRVNFRDEIRSYMDYTKSK
jgi:hypothetical protein